MKNENICRKLYLSEDMKSFINLILDSKTPYTCEKIFVENELGIKTKIKENYPNTKLEDFYFYLIDINEIKNNKRYIKYRINKNFDLIKVLSISNMVLFYLPHLKDENEKDNNRNIAIEDKRIISSNEKLSKIKENYPIKKIAQNIENKIYYYDYYKKCFILSKISLDNINLKILLTNLEIPLKEITKMEYGDKSIQRLSFITLDNTKIIPKHFIVLTTLDNQIILGYKDKNNFDKLINLINLSINKYKTFIKDLEFQMEINNSKINISKNSEVKKNNLFEYEKLLKNDERVKIFDFIFKDKNITKILENSFLYKKAINDKNYEEGIIKLKEIINIVDEKNKDEKNENNKIINDIIKKETYNKYIEVYNKVNDLKNNQKNEELSKVLNIDLLDENINYLNLIDKSDVIDNTFRNRIKSNINKIETNFLAYNFMKTYNFQDENSFLLIDNSK